MKKILIFFGILVLVAVAGLAIFIATFNLDRYRPQVIQQIETVVRKPVQIERLSLGWRGGIALEMKGLMIGSGDKAQPEPIIQVEKVSSVVRLWPLLKKDIQVASVSIVRPRLYLERRPNGSINLMELVPPQEQKGVPASTQRAAEILPLLIGMIRVEDGTIRVVDQMQQPPLNLILENLEVTVRNASLSRLDLQNLSARLAGGTVKLKGTVEGLTSQPRAKLNANLEKVALESLLPAQAPGQPSVRGRLSASFDGSVQGTDPQQILATLAGNGQVNLSDGVFVNMNILREVFQKISILPGLVETLLTRLPESYQARFAENDTRLKNVQTQFSVSGGALSFSNLRVETDTFELGGAGQAGLDGSVNAKATLTVEPQLSAAIIRSVAELQYLTDKQGRLEFPVTIRGHAPRLALLPDVGHLASHLTREKAEELIGDVLNRVLNKKKDLAADPTQGTH